MPGKTDIFNLGEKGVNVVKSPIHREDGELSTAQNAQVIPYNAQRALSKRRGMSLLNATTAAAGAIMNFFRVSLADPNPSDVDPVVTPGNLLFFIPWNSAFSTFHRFPPDTPDLSSASWINITESFRNAGYPSEQNRIFRLPSTGSVVWYPATANGRRWEQYDDNTDSTASGFSLPTTGSNGATTGDITSYCTDGTNIYVAVKYGGTYPPNAIYKCTQAGVVTLVGQEFCYAGGTGPGSVPRITDDYAGSNCCWWNGRLWTVGVDVTSYATFQMTIYSIDPSSESVWTLEHSEADLTDEFGGWFPTVAPGGDYLYACYFSFNASPMKHYIYRRSTSGTLTQVLKENLNTSWPSFDYAMHRAIYGTGSSVLIANPYRQLWSDDAMATYSTASTSATWRYHTDVVESGGKLYYGTWILTSPWSYSVWELSTAGASSEVTSSSRTTALRSLLLGEV